MFSVVSKVLLLAITTSGTAFAQAPSLQVTYQRLDIDFDGAHSFLHPRVQFEGKNLPVAGRKFQTISYCTEGESSKFVSLENSAKGLCRLFGMNLARFEVENKISDGQWSQRILVLKSDGSLDHVTKKSFGSSDCGAWGGLAYSIRRISCKE